MNRRSTRMALAGVALMAGLTTGCSQVAELQPVAGDAVTSVRIAAYDVLIDNKVAIRVAPTCTYTDVDYTCKGTTADDKPILVEAKQLAAYGATQDEFGADNEAKVTLKVSVGGEQIYKGYVNDVLTKEAQAGS